VARPYGRIAPCALGGFWRFWGERTYYEINRWNDPRPFVYELAQSARSVISARSWTSASIRDSATRSLATRSDAVRSLLQLEQAEIPGVSSLGRFAALP